ncbi:MAG: cupin domain-containing protein [Ktedonobacteraceae bacterium]
MNQPWRSRSSILPAPITSLARLVTIPANRAFARHIHPNAYHFIYVVSGTGVLEYDGARYVLKPGEYCVVCKGVVHKLGAGEDGLLAMIVNSPR